MSNPRASDEQIHELFVLLWKRSTVEPRDIRIEPGTSSDIHFRTTAHHLVLETMTDPEKEVATPRVLQPSWEQSTHTVHLLGENLPTWILAFVFDHQHELYTPKECIYTLLKKPKLHPAPDAIRRWTLAAST